MRPRLAITRKQNSREQKQSPIKEETCKVLKRNKDRGNYKPTPKKANTFQQSVPLDYTCIRLLFCEWEIKFYSCLNATEQINRTWTIIM